MTESSLQNRLYLSTIADIGGSSAESGFTFSNKTSAIASRFGLGLELAEFSVSANLDNQSPAAAEHFERNLCSATRFTLHAPFQDLYPHAIDRKVAAIAEERYLDCYTLCIDNNIPKMIVHANYCNSFYHPDWFVSSQIAFWKSFLKDHPGKTIVCIENVLETDPDLLIRIVEAVNDPRIRLCLDVGHANLTPLPAVAWFDRCAPYLSHLHLHNNCGRSESVWPAASDTHSALQNGTVPMNEILQKLLGLPGDVTAAIESNELESSLHWLTECGYLPANDSTSENTSLC